jgi:LacI family transcriptional regulator, gluconate utilization system Gnt-I transcriptional repressor
MAGKKKKRRRSAEGPHNVRTIAQAAGLSPITVSRAFRNPGKLAPATLARIMKVAEGVGFVPDQIASSMRSSSSLVGTIVPPLINSGIAEQVQGMSDACQERNLQLLLIQGDFAVDAEERAIRTLLGWRPAGLVVQAFVQSPRAVTLLRANGLPVIEISEIAGREPIDIAVGVSNFDTAFSMTTRLAEIGYKRIAFVSTPIHGNDRLQQRRIGYRKALESRNMVVAERLEIEMPITSAGGSEALNILKLRDPTIDAVFFSSDVLAIGGVQECHRRGWRIPKDVAIAGYGDTELAAQLFPRLTTVRVPRYQMGRKSIEVLARRIAGEAGLPRQVAMPFVIVERETT